MSTQLKKDMRSIYQLKGFDFMGYTYRTIDDLSYHHIIKACDGGERTLENGALLNKDTSHPYLHVIECRDLDTYIAINNVLKDINNQYSRPTKEQLIVIRYYLQLFERKYRRAENSKGLKLIRPQYIEGRIDLNEYNIRGKGK